MDRLEEAKLIISAVRDGHFTLRFHAKKRSIERAISREQVIKIAETTVEWKWQEKEETHWFLGAIEAGSAYGFTAAAENGVWIVTVFKRSLKKWQKGQE